MPQGVPFDPSLAIPGAVLRGIDPASLQAGRNRLERWRLELQFRLQQQGVPRHTMITVSTDGIVYDGNHAVRVAIDRGAAVDIVITDQPTIGYGSIMDVPIEE
jgi:hypothetical protein